MAFTTVIYANANRNGNNTIELSFDGILRELLYWFNLNQHIDDDRSDYDNKFHNSGYFTPPDSFKWLTKYNKTALNIEMKDWYVPNAKKEDYETLSGKIIEDLVKSSDLQTILTTNLFTANTLGYFSGKQLNELSLNTFVGALDSVNSSYKYNYLSQSAIGRLDQAHVEALESRSRRLFILNQSIAASTLNLFDTHQIAWLSAKYLSFCSESNLINNSVIKGMTGAQLKGQSSEWLGKLSAIQVSNINDAAFLEFGYSIKLFSAAQLTCLTAKQINNLTIYDLPPDEDTYPIQKNYGGQWSYLDPATQAVILKYGAGSLSKAVLSSLTSSQIASISNEQIQILATTSLDGVSASFISSLKPEMVWSLSDKNLEVLKTNNNFVSASAVAGLTLRQYQLLTGYDTASKVSKYPLTSKPCLVQMSASQIKALSTADLLIIRPLVLSELTETQFTYFTREQALNVSAHQIAQLSKRQISSFTVHPLAGMSGADFAKLNDADIALLQPGTAASLTADDIHSVNAFRIQLLTKDQVVNISVFKQLDVTDLQKFSKDQLSWMTDDQLNQVGANSSLAFYILKILGDTPALRSKLETIPTGANWTPSPILTNNRNFYTVSNALRSMMAVSQIQSRVDTTWAARPNLQPDVQYDNAKRYAGAVAAQRQLLQGMRFISTFQAGAVAAAYFYKASVDKHDKLASDVDLLRACAAIASAAQVPLSMLAAAIYDYKTKKYEYLRDNRNGWAATYDQAILESKVFKDICELDPTYGDARARTFRSKLTRLYLKQQTVAGDKTVADILKSRGLVFSPNADIDALNLELRGVCNDPNGGGRFRGITITADNIVSLRAIFRTMDNNLIGSFTATDAAYLDLEPGRLLELNSELEPTTRDLMEHEQGNKFSRKAKAVYDSNPDAMLELNARVFQMLPETADPVQKAANEAVLNASRNEGWKTVLKKNLFITENGAGTALNDLGTALKNLLFRGRLTFPGTSGNQGGYFLGDPAKPITYRSTAESFTATWSATAKATFEFLTKPGSPKGFVNRGLRGGFIFGAANGLGLGTAIMSTVTANGDPTTIVFGSLTAGASSVVLVADLIDLIAGGQSVVAVGGTLSKAQVFSQAASRLMGPAQMALMTFAYGLQIANAAKVYEADKSAVNLRTIVCDVVFDVFILSITLAAALTKNPILVAIAFVTSIVLPNFEALAQQQSLRQASDDAHAKGLYLQADIANRLSHAYGAQSIPLRNWDSNILQNALRHIEDLMTTGETDASWLTALQEAFSYQMEEDKKNVAYSDSIALGLIQGLKDELQKINETGIGKAVDEIQMIVGQASNSKDYWVTNSLYSDANTENRVNYYRTDLHVYSDTATSHGTNKAAYEVKWYTEWVKYKNTHLTQYITATDLKKKKVIQVLAAEDFKDTMDIDASNSTQDLSFIVLTNAKVNIYAGQGQNTFMVYGYSGKLEDAQNLHIFHNTDAKKKDLFDIIQFFAIKGETTRSIILLDNLGTNNVVTGSSYENDVRGTKSGQIYTSDGSHDTISMTGGKADVTVSGRGNNVVLGGGNNVLHVNLGYEADVNKTITVFDGGICPTDPAPAVDPVQQAADEAAYVRTDKFPVETRSPGMLGDNENTITFLGATKGLLLNINDLNVESVASTNSAGDTAGSLPDDTVKFKNFAKIQGSTQGDIIVVTNTTNIDTLELGLGFNSVTVNQSKALIISYQGANHNTININNSQVGIVSTAGSANITVSNGSSVVASFSGYADLVNAADKTLNTIIASTGFGLHSLSLDSFTHASIILNSTESDNLTKLIDVSTKGRVSGKYDAATETVVDVGTEVKLNLGPKMASQILGVDTDGTVLHFASTEGFNRKLDYSYADGSKVWDSSTKKTTENAEKIILDYSLEGAGAVITVAEVLTQMDKMASASYLPQNTINGVKYFNLGDVIDRDLTLDHRTATGDITSNNSVLGNSIIHVDGNFVVSGTGNNVYVLDNTKSEVTLTGSENTLHGGYGTNSVIISGVNNIAKIYGTGSNVELLSNGQNLTLNSFKSNVKVTNANTINLTISDLIGFSTIDANINFSGNVYGFNTKINLNASGAGVVVVHGKDNLVTGLNSTANHITAELRDNQSSLTTVGAGFVKMYGDGQTETAYSSKTTVSYTGDGVVSHVFANLSTIDSKNYKNNLIDFSGFGSALTGGVGTQFWIYGSNNTVNGQAVTSGQHVTVGVDGGFVKETVSGFVAANGTDAKTEASLAIKSDLWLRSIFIHTGETVHLVEYPRTVYTDENAVNVKIYDDIGSSTINLSNGFGGLISSIGKNTSVDIASNSSVSLEGKNFSVTTNADSGYLSLMADSTASVSGNGHVAAISGSNSVLTLNNSAGVVSTANNLLNVTINANLANVKVGTGTVGSVNGFSNTVTLSGGTSHVDMQGKDNVVSGLSGTKETGAWVGLRDSYSSLTTNGAGYVALYNSLQTLTLNSSSSSVEAINVNLKDIVVNDLGGSSNIVVADGFNGKIAGKNTTLTFKKSGRAQLSGSNLTVYGLSLPTYIIGRGIVQGSRVDLVGDGSGVTTYGSGIVTLYGKNQKLTMNGAATTVDVTNANSTGMSINDFGKNSIVGVADGFKGTVVGTGTMVAFKASGYAALTGTNLAASKLQGAVGGSTSAWVDLFGDGSSLTTTGAGFVGLYGKNQTITLKTAGSTVWANIANLTGLTIKDVGGGANIIVQDGFNGTVTGNNTTFSFNKSGVVSLSGTNLTANGLTGSVSGPTSARVDLKGYGSSLTANGSGLVSLYDKNQTLTLTGTKSSVLVAATSLSGVTIKDNGGNSTINVAGALDGSVYGAGTTINLQSLNKQQIRLTGTSITVYGSVAIIGIPVVVLQLKGSNSSVIVNAFAKVNSSAENQTINLKCSNSAVRVSSGLTKIIDSAGGSTIDVERYGSGELYGNNSVINFIGGSSSKSVFDLYGTNITANGLYISADGSSNFNSVNLLGLGTSVTTTGSGFVNMYDSKQKITLSGVGSIVSIEKASLFGLEIIDKGGEANISAVGDFDAAIYGNNTTVNLNSGNSHIQVHGKDVMVNGLKIPSADTINVTVGLYDVASSARVSGEGYVGLFSNDQTVVALDDNIHVVGKAESVTEHVFADSAFVDFSNYHNDMVDFTGSGSVLKGGVGCEFWVYGANNVVNGNTVESSSHVTVKADGSLLIQAMGSFAAATGTSAAESLTLAAKSANWLAGIH